MGEGRAAPEARQEKGVVLKTAASIPSLMEAGFLKMLFQDISYAFNSKMLPQKIKQV